MLQHKKIVFLLLLMTLVTSCHKSDKKFVIGISQCSEDIWREKQNAEMRMAAYFHDNVELRFAAAFDSDERQVQQIDSLVATGIDLLIVAPNQVATISPAIDRAYDHGLPVIVFERKTSSQKYSAFISADNYEMGRTMGEHIAQQLSGHGRVLEVMGLRGSSPAIDRHKGFTDALSNYPGIQLLSTLQGDWTEESGYEAVRQFLTTSAANVDFVFAQNDRMAMGARRAMKETLTTLPRFCGIDGLPGKDGGIQLVQDSILDATYIYPTHGDQLLQTAVNILEGKHYEKETHLMSALVTSDNARVLQMQSDEIVRQSDYLDQLHSKASNYLQQLNYQRIIALLAFTMVALLLLVAVIIYWSARQRSRIANERRQMERAQLDFYTQAAHELRTPLTLIEGPLAQLAETPDIQQAEKKTTELFAIVRRNTQQLTTLIGKILDQQVKDSAPDLDAEETAIVPDTPEKTDDSPASQGTDGEKDAQSSGSAADGSDAASRRDVSRAVSAPERAGGDFRTCRDRYRRAARRKRIRLGAPRRSDHTRSAGEKPAGRDRSRLCIRDGAGRSVDARADGHGPHDRRRRQYGGGREQSYHFADRADCGRSVG